MLPSDSSYATAAEEAFEIAVNRYTTQENRKLLWKGYINFRLRILSEAKSSDKPAQFKAYIEVASRCLSSIPASTSVPLYSHSKFWDDYGFHNEVCNLCHILFGVFMLVITVAHLEIIILEFSC